MYTAYRKCLICIICNNYGHTGNKQFRFKLHEVCLLWRPPFWNETVHSTFIPMTTRLSVTYSLHPWILTSCAGLLAWQQRRVMLVIHGWSFGQSLASSILILSREQYFTPSTTPGTSLVLSLLYARLQVKDWYKLLLPSSSLWSSNQELPILHLSWSAPPSVSAVCMCRASFTNNSCPQHSTTLQRLFLVEGVTTHPACYGQFFLCSHLQHFFGFV